MNKTREPKLQTDFALGQNEVSEVKDKVRRVWKKEHGAVCFEVIGGEH